MPSAPHEPGGQRQRRQRRGSARRRPAGAHRSARRCARSAAAGATIASQREAARHVAVVDVAQLVGDDEPHLGAAGSRVSSVS